MLPQFKLTKTVALCTLAGCVLWISGCGSSPARPNIVMVVMDTVRSDHLACYGYTRNTTPRLSQLARESTLYKNAYSVSSWTSSAHASLFTGLYPATHQCTQERWRLDTKFVTLAEALRGAGYQTLAIVENPLLSTVNGFDQGFQTFHEAWRLRPAAEPGERDETLDLLRETVARLPGKEPFFMFLNILEAHNPYNSSRQFFSTFVTDRSIPLVRQVARDFYLGRRTYSSAELQHLGELYDAEILYDDWFVGQLVDELKSKRLWDNTILVITSDHGENIGDHGHVDHVFTLYESVTKVPLLIRDPRFFAQGVVDPDPTQLTDLFPTLLNLLGLESSTSQGLDLRRDGIRKGRQILCEYGWPVQALLTFGQDRNNPALNKWKRRIQSVTDGESKLILASDGRHEMYELSQDPGETRNLAALPEKAAELRRLEGLLKSLLARYPRGETPGGAPAVGELDDATREALRSLGYVR